MNGLRLVLFGVNSDAGLGAIPRMPLSFFLGGAGLPPQPFLLPEKRTRAAAEESEEDVAC